MNPTQEFIAHMRNLYAVSGDAPPTVDQWREIKDKLYLSTMYQHTGTLEGLGDMDKVTDQVVAVSC